MDFYPNQLFHIYNQGNDRQKIFFSDDNYEFFLWKMRAYLLPYGDFAAYCLMPNHFHWLFYVRRVEVNKAVHKAHVVKTQAQRRSKQGHPPKKPIPIASSRETISLNEAIGIVQSSYTRAINEYLPERSGSLFRKPCKAKDGWIDEFVTLENKYGRLDTRFLPGTNYAGYCFHYIHDNPREAGLVANNLDWPYSSARDYAGQRRGTLCNLALGREIMG
jgi:putative transposase